MEVSRLESRVIPAAEEALARQHYVSPIDLFLGMRLLYPGHVESWRKGRLEFLEQYIQGNPEKRRRSFEIFARWAQAKGLRLSEAAYTCITRAGARELRFTQEGDPATERLFRTHWISPALSAKQQEKLAARVNRAEQPAVFEIVRDSACSECGVELPRGSLLWMEGGQPLCLACAGRDDLEFLPAGDTALTRRASKYSARSNVVVRFSRSRKRYERQGILVEPAALEKAEQECVADAEARAAGRVRAAERRKEEDREFIARMTGEIRELFPGCPPAEARHIAVHTAQRGSGRVGRSAAGRQLDPKALTVAVAAAIRHRHTKYDELLASGADREDARARVSDRVQDILESWRNS